MTTDLSHPETRFIAPAPPLEQPVVRIRPSRGWAALRLAELWAYRELLYFFVWRDVKVRYKQTVLGAAWAVLQPFVTMVVFSLFFGYLIGVESDGIAYPLFSYTALVPWTFFANSLTQATSGMVSNADLLKKVYFPRLALPLARVLAGVIDFALAFAVLLVMMPFFNVWPTARLLWLPLLVLLALITALGVGLWFAAMNVQFRDVGFVVPFVIQFWMYATPIVYPSSIVPEAWRTLYALNPMVGVVEGFRWALLDAATAPGPMVAVSALVAAGLLVSGAYYFKRMERTFADVV